LAAVGRPAAAVAVAVAAAIVRRQFPATWRCDDVIKSDRSVSQKLPQHIKTYKQ